ncbi:MAG: hypothetical protein Q4G67_08345 [Actinomycetia bacterium]|nr:hypothetical protein [Actinomycetes bacterium]
MTRLSPERTEPGGHVVFIGLTSISVRTVVGHAEFLLDRGVRVTVMTADPIPYHERRLDGRAEMIDLTRAEVQTGPFRVRERLRRYSVGGPVQNFAYKVSNRAYKVMRPAILWRAAEGEVAGWFDWSQVDEVVLADAHAVPLGWHVARRHPDLRVTFALDRSRYENDTDADQPREAAEI